MAGRDELDAGQVFAAERKAWGWQSKKKRSLLRTGAPFY